jgi:hypothetical protein
MNEQRTNDEQTTNENVDEVVHYNQLWPNAQTTNERRMTTSHSESMAQRYMLDGTTGQHNTTTNYMMKMMRMMTMMITG